MTPPPSLGAPLSLPGRCTGKLQSGEEVGEPAAVLLDAVAKAFDRGVDKPVVDAIQVDGRSGDAPGGSRVASWLP